MSHRKKPNDLRSRAWFDNPHNTDMTALYLERYLNFGPVSYTHLDVYKRQLEDFPEDAWRTIMASNLDSVFFVGQAVAKKMLPRKRGKIINTCSVMSELGRASVSPYVANKGAVKMLTKAMATEWGPKGLNVNGIGPGYFKTELTDALVNDKTFTAWLEARTPQGRWGDVEELVGAAIYLASNASVYVNGHVLYVDGGLTSSV